MSKKKLVSLSLVVIMIAILSFSSLAWFNATDSVENKFMIADSDNDGLPDFSVEVFEHDKDNQEVDNLTFENIAPNAQLAKDPTVRNTGDYSMYTRLVVTLSDATTWLNASQKYDLTGTEDDKIIFEKLVNIDTAHWIRYDDPTIDTATDTITYVYYYNGVVAAGAETEALFTKVTIPHQLQQDDMNFGTDKTFTMTIRADAIQSENIVNANSSLTQFNDAYKAFIETANWQANAAYPQP